MVNHTNNVSWPGWDVVRVIGRGSFGTVYEIRRDVHGRIEHSALKVISIPHNEDEVDYLRSTGTTEVDISKTLQQQVSDIAREYNIMAEMRENPCVVRCEDYEEKMHPDKLGWDVYIKMELLTPLMKALDQVRTEEQIIRLGTDLCTALKGCHERDVIHRDIKPQNVFLAKNGRFKLGDFGIAKVMDHATHATVGIGTYSFMAPEVATNKQYGKTADIYSLGLLLYWLLNEYRAPFVTIGKNAPTKFEEESARRRRFAGEPVPAPKHGSYALKSVVLKACAYDPNERYQTADDMLKAINSTQTDTVMFGHNEEDLSADGSGSLKSVPLPEEDGTVGPQFVTISANKRKKSKSIGHWLALATAAVIVVAVIGGTVLLGKLWQEKAQQSPADEKEAEVLVKEQEVPEEELEEDLEITEELEENAYEVDSAPELKEELVVEKEIEESTKAEPDSIAEINGIYFPFTSIALSEGTTLSTCVYIDWIKRQPDAAVWSSSDPDVAYVKNDKIYAMQSGEAVITIECCGISASCNVVVLKPDSQKSVPLRKSFGTRTDAFYEYDAYGNLLLSNEDDLTTVNQYIDGRLVRVSQLQDSVLRGEKLIYTKDYAYGSNGILQQVDRRWVTFQGVTIAEEFTIYDDTGKALYMTSNGEDYSDTTVYEYDSNGNLLFERVYDNLASEATRERELTTYQYDLAGNLTVKRVDSVSLGVVSLDKHIEYKYDSSNRLTQMKEWGYNWSISKCENYTYNDNNQIIEMYDEINNVTYSYTYDDAYNLIMETIAYGDSPYTYIYEYRTIPVSS